MYDIKQRSGLDGVPGKVKVSGVKSVDLIDFNFNMSGNTQFDQVRILEYLDRWGTVVEKQEKDNVSHRQLINHQAKNLVQN